MHKGNMSSPCQYSDVFNLLILWTKFVFYLQTFLITQRDFKFTTATLVVIYITVAYSFIVTCRKARINEQLPTSYCVIRNAERAEHFTSNNSSFWLVFHCINIFRKRIHKLLKLMKFNINDYSFLKYSTVNLISKC